MGVTLKRLATAALSDSAQPVYSPSGVNAQVDACAMTNNTDVAQTVDLWVTAGGGPTAETIVLKSFKVDPAATSRAWSMGGQVIESGSTVYARASAPGAVILVMSGREQTVAA